MNKMFLLHNRPQVIVCVGITILMSILSGIVLLFQPILLPLLILIGGGMFLFLFIRCRAPKGGSIPPWLPQWRLEAHQQRRSVLSRPPKRPWIRKDYIRSYRFARREATLVQDHSSNNVLENSPMLVATLAGVIDRLCRTYHTPGVVTTIRHTSRQLRLELMWSSEPDGDQYYQFRESLRHLVPLGRVRGATTVQVPLPPVVAPTVGDVVPCLPLFRRGRTTTWYPLTTLGHLMLAGPAMYVLAAHLASLLPHVQAGQLRLLYDDPEELLYTLPFTGIRGTSDARVQTRQQALQYTWQEQQGLPHPTPPLVLVAIQPDATAWADLVPLLTSPYAGVHVVILLGETQVEVVRTMCHQVPVLELGGSGASQLPEAARPPGIALPRAGQTVFWQSGQLIGRGQAVCMDETTLYREWLDVRASGGR